MLKTAEIADACCEIQPLESALQEEMIEISSMSRITLTIMVYQGFEVLP
jgi:hypothetical protein